MGAQPLEDIRRLIDTALEASRSLAEAAEKVKEGLDALEARFASTGSAEAPRPPLAWGAKVSPEFREFVHVMGSDFRCPPDWFMAVMAFETMETFSPKVRPMRNNKPISSAIGLIQFLRRTALGLGTTTEALAEMTAEEQLKYVWLYFRNSIRHYGPIATLEDCYMHVHWPAAVGKPNSAQMYVKGTDAYAANAGLDLDGNHIITKAEAGHLVRQKLIEGRLPVNMA